MPDKTWKAAERAFARDMGTERIPVTGERDGADAETAMFLLSVKHREKQYPRTVAGWLARVVAKARSRTPGKIGIVVIQHPHQRRAKALVVLTWADWLDLHGPHYQLTEKAVQHIESGCQLAPGHEGPCLTEDDVDAAAR